MFLIPARRGRRGRFPLRRRVRRLAAVSIAISAVCVVLAAPRSVAAAFTAMHPLPGLGSGRIWDVAVDPADPATILAATDAGVFTSKDGGVTWRQTLAGGRTWAVGFDARSATDAFAGTAGRGVYASPDAGLTWSPASDGLNNRDIRALAFGLDGIAAGTDSGVYLSRDGHGWHDDGLDGDSISCLAIAANSPQLTVIAGSDNGNLTSAFLFRNGGSGWSPLQSGLPAGAVASALTAGPIDQAVTQRPLVVVTTKGIFRSGDSGTTWSPSTGVPSTLTATTATFDPLDPGIVYAGADQGGSTGGDLLRSTDSGVTFAAADAGLPSASKNVETIGIGPTNPLTVIVGLDPPNGGASLYVEQDASLPAPPQLTPESPGAAVTTVVSTPPPKPTPTPRSVRTSATPAPATGLAGFAETAFHWPVPLVYEIIFVLLVIYALVRWRQHYYVEGPP